MNQLQLPDNEPRYVERRSQFLQSVNGIKKNHGEALAWKELGYTRSSIARKIDYSSTSVKKWLDAIAEEFDQSVLYSREDDFFIQLDLEDRKKTLPFSCPQCRNKRLVDGKGLINLPDKLTATRDGEGRLWPVNNRREMLINGERIELDEDDLVIDGRELFFASEKEMVCLDCLWMGMGKEVIPNE